MRLKWSDFKRGEEVDIIIDSIENAKLYMFNDYILCQAEIDFEDYRRSVELSVPYYKLKKEIQSLPVYKQQWFLDGKVKIRLKKLDKGKMKMVKVKNE